MTNDYRRSIRDLRRVLEEAIPERDARPDWEDGELGWVRYERGVMHDAVNRLRARIGAAPGNADAIIRAETLASGHIDYVSKFAIQCANLVRKEVADD